MTGLSLPPAHRATSAHVGALFPFMAEPVLGATGPYVGRDLLGGSFCYDPFDLYAAGVLTNPNMVVVGQIGRGKSSLVKTYLWRQSLLGAQAWVIDPKGEYGPLARAWGVEPLTLAPGGKLRLNPLEGASMTAARPDDRRSALLAALAEACLGRTLNPRERACLDVALTEAAQRNGGRPLVAHVVDALLRPDEARAGALASDARTLSEDGREVALELRRLVTGDLRGMFDGPTTRGLRVDGPLVVLDLSAVYGSAALPVLMACATAWVQATLDRSTPRRRLLVVDEAWAILSNLGVARWLQACWKLSRAYGVANLAVLHRLSDLRAAGPAGSEQVLLAEGLLSDSETRVVYAQSHGEAAASQELLGLSGTEVDLLPRLGRGVGLWKVGRRSFLVEHRLSDLEARLVDTDARMAGKP
ncbi:MAG: ATP-binding protein, partial [Acidimicrobiales bacterium]